MNAARTSSGLIDLVVVTGDADGEGDEDWGGAGAVGGREELSATGLELRSKSGESRSTIPEAARMRTRAIAPRRSQLGLVGFSCAPRFVMTASEAQSWGSETYAECESRSTGSRGRRPGTPLRL
jgi:hypothetical protein